MNYLEKLLNGEKVEWKALGEIATIYGGLIGKTKKDFEQGNARFITYKNIFDNLEVDENLLESVQVGIDEKQHEVKYGDILFTGSSETPKEVGMSSAVTRNFSEKIYLNSFSFGIRFNEDIVLIPEFAKFLFRGEFMRNQIIKTASGVTRFNVSKERFKKIQIPIPPLHIQQKIVDILDKFCKLKTALKTERELRLKQYAYYRDKLLTFEEDVEWRILGDIFDVRDGTHDSPKKKDFGKYLITSKNIKNGTIDFSTAYCIDEDDFNSINKRSQVNKNDLLFTMIGTIGEIAYIDFNPDFAIKNVGLIKIGEHITGRFLFHFLQSTTVKNYIHNNKSKGTQGFLSLGNLRKIPIPVLPLETQQKIVEILDKLDTYCNSLTEGLPKEIELREKQYQYYRDLLLDFPKN